MELVAFPAEGNEAPVVCSRVTDAKGCWLCLGEVHSKFLSHIPYATFVQKTKRARIRRRATLLDERQALAGFGAIKRQSPIVQLFKINSLVKFLRGEDQEQHQAVISRLLQVESLPVLRNTRHEGENAWPALCHSCLAVKLCPETAI